MMRPNGSNVLVKPVEEPEDNAFGIIVCGAPPPQRPDRGIVVAVGRGRRLPNFVASAEGCYIPLDFDPGDEILFFGDDAIELEIEGERLFLVEADSVLVVLDEALDPVTNRR